jgi:lipopolysaccharide export system protein LptA
MTPPAEMSGKAQAAGCSSFENGISAHRSGACRFHLVVLAGFLIWPLVMWSATQKMVQKPIPAKGFKVAEPYDPPYETQTKSLVVGETALVFPNGNAELSDGVTLRTFSETNTPQLIVQGDNCFYNKTNQSVNSAGPIKIQTADGKFTIEGTGFYWLQLNSSFTLSNDVRTAIQAELLQATSTNTIPNSTDPASGPVFISSRQFSYDGLSGRGTWRDNVQVTSTNATGTNLALSSSSLIAEVPVKKHEVRSLLADQNVVVDYSGLHGTSEHLAYSPSTGLLRLTDKATWQSEERKGGGDELIIDRSNQVFQVNHHAWLKMPGQAIGQAGFLSSSNAPAPQATRSIELTCENYEIRTNSGAHFADFHDQVRLEERLDDKVRGRMSCDNMKVTFSNTNEFDTLTVDRNVIIEETGPEGKRFTAGHGLYTHTNAILVLTEDPEWSAGLRKGKGDIIRVNTQQNEMTVQGDASLRLPANELAGQLSLTNASISTNRTAKTSTNQFAEIFSEEYTLRTNHSVFIGGVYATHPEMNWSCEKLTVDLPGTGMTNFVAEQNVVFGVMTPKGEVRGKGDKAVYSFGFSKVFTNAASQIDEMTLTGTPASLTNGTNGMSQNPVIIWDRLRNKVQFPGSDYRIQGFAKPIDTNIFVLPNKKRKK